MLQGIYHQLGPHSLPSSIKMHTVVVEVTTPDEIEVHDKGMPFCILLTGSSIKTFARLVFLESRVRWLFVAVWDGNYE